MFTYAISTPFKKNLRCNKPNTSTVVILQLFNLLSSLILVIIVNLLNLNSATKKKLLFLQQIITVYYCRVNYCTFESLKTVIRN